MSFFSNAHVVGHDVRPDRYGSEKIERGAAGYTIRQSDLSEIARCPHRWRHGFHRKDTDALDWGSLIDMLMFFPDQWEEVYAITPETYTNDKGEERPWNFNATVCKQWRQDIGERFELKPAESARAHAATARLRDDYDVSSVLEGAATQVMVCGDYMDDEFDLRVPCKGLIDFVPDKAIGVWGRCLGDLKTTRNADPRHWARTVWAFGWHVQAAFYLDLYCAATGEDRTDWIHIIQESFEPFEIGRRIISGEFVELGRRAYRSAIRLYARCLARDEWPTYDEMRSTILPGFTLIGPEDWMANEVASKMAEISPITTPLYQTGRGLAYGEEELREVVP